MPSKSCFRLRYESHHGRSSENSWNMLRPYRGMTPKRKRADLQERGLPLDGSGLPCPKRESCSCKRDPPHSSRPGRRQIHLRPPPPLPPLPPLPRHRRRRHPPLLLLSTLVPLTPRGILFPRLQASGDGKRGKPRGWPRKIAYRGGRGGFLAGRAVRPPIGAMENTRGTGVGKFSTKHTSTSHRKPQHTTPHKYSKSTPHITHSSPLEANHKSQYNASKQNAHHLTRHKPKAHPHGP